MAPQPEPSYTVHAQELFDFGPNVVRSKPFFLGKGLLPAVAAPRVRSLGTRRLSPGRPGARRTSRLTRAGPKSADPHEGGDPPGSSRPPLPRGSAA